MSRCCCGKYDATQEEDFLMNDTQHQMLGKSQSYDPFCGPMKDHRICCLEATIAEKEEAIDKWQEQYIKDIRINADQIASLEGDNEILRNMGKALKDSIVALAADRDRLQKEMPCHHCGIRKYGYCEDCKEALRGKEEK